MASETVMYMSLLLIGMLAFGFFSYSFGNYSGWADEQTAESNLNDIMSKVSLRIEGLLNKANELKGSGSAGSTIALNASLDIPVTLNGESYSIYFVVDGQNNVYLTGKISLKNLVQTSINMGMINSSVTFHGSFSSSGGSSPRLSYVYNVNLGTETISLTN